MVKMRTYIWGTIGTVKLQPTIILTGRQDCSVHFFTLLVSVILGKEEGKDEVQVFNTALREILDYLILILSLSCD